MRRSVWVNKICENCGIKFEIKESSLKYGRGKCCSRKCVDENKKRTYCGKNNGMFGVKYSDEKKQDISDRSKVLWQTEEFRNKVKTGQNKFLEDNGYWPGQSKTSQQTRKNTMIEKYGIEHNWNGKYGFRKCDKTCVERYGMTSSELRLKSLHNIKSTKIEDKIECILIENNILYQKNYKIIYDRDNVKYKYYDFYLSEYNIVIEADGDYWHGNPMFFTMLNGTQLKNIKNDEFKNKLANDNGFKILRFWENEIHKDEFAGILLEAIGG